MFRGGLRTITRRKIADRYRRTQAQPVGLGDLNADERLCQAPANEDSADPTEADALHQFHLRELDLIRAEFGERSWRMFWPMFPRARWPRSRGVRRHPCCNSAR